MPVRAQSHHGNSAHPVKREVGDDELGRVRQLHDNAVTRLQAQVEQGDREPP
jgi:hypothetical protein